MTIRFYHMVCERYYTGERKEYISRTAGKVPGEGWKCICVCGFHEVNREGKNEGVDEK